MLLKRLQTGAVFVLEGGLVATIIALADLVAQLCEPLWPDLPPLASQYTWLPIVKDKLGIRRPHVHYASLNQVLSGHDTLRPD